MKRLAAALLALVLCLSMVACASGNATKTDPATPAADAQTASSETSETTQTEESNSKPTMLYYTGFIGDFGLNDMGWSAAQAAAEKYGYDLTLVEFGADTSQAVASLIDAMDTKHYDYVLCMSWYISDTIFEKSRSGEWADTTFIMYDTSPDTDLSGINNIYGVAFAQNEGSFLSAVYSALMTQTGKIGACINLDTPITNDFGAGWLCGYKYAVNDLGMSDLGMVYTYMSELSVQSNYESVNVILDNGCDFVYDVAGSYILGAMQAADEKGGPEANKFVIGCDYDQYSYFKQAGEVQGWQTLVTSMLKNVEPCVAMIFENLNGEATGIEPGNHVYGLAEGGVSLADNENYQTYTPKDVQDKISEIRQKIIDGEIDVVSYYDFNTYEAFAAYRDNPAAAFEP